MMIDREITPTSIIKQVPVSLFLVAAGTDKGLLSENVKCT